MLWRGERREEVEGAMLDVDETDGTACADPCNLMQHIKTLLVCGQFVQNAC